MEFNAASGPIARRLVPTLGKAACEGFRKEGYTPESSRSRPPSTFPGVIFPTKGAVKGELQRHI
jgi:hypothetical protein